MQPPTPVDISVIAPQTHIYINFNTKKITSINVTTLWKFFSVSLCLIMSIKIIDLPHQTGYLL